MPTAASQESYVTSLGRAVVGAMLFGMPLIMTMEMWQLALSMDRPRLLLFLIIGFGLVLGLAFYAGFRDARGWANDIKDTGAALAIGAGVSILLLGLFGVYDRGEPLSILVAKTALQTIPAAMGAVLARRQLGGRKADIDDAAAAPGPLYVGELFLMVAGALFLAFNLAPTEEMVLIAFQMGPVQTLLLAALSIILLHLLVFRLGFAGQETHETPWQAFIQFTSPGYAIALGVSLYVLWTFGRLDGLSAHETLSTAIVLAFPASLGAALARLVV